jgi:prepilin-type N-terminal cleavage/methylation domain-containing protein
MASGSPRGFTLLEMMVSITVLLAVMIAISKIFATARDVSLTGQATADILQDAAAIERLIRTDIENMSGEGFLAIHSIAVPNDLNAQRGQRLIDPTKDPDAEIRSDQIIFIRSGAQSPQAMSVAGGYELNAGHSMGEAAKIYYGHGVQLSLLPAYDLERSQGMDVGFDPQFYQESVEDGEATAMLSFDPSSSNPQLRFGLPPWFQGNVAVQETNYDMQNIYNIYQRNTVFDAPAHQAEATVWPLLRQVVVLADDDGYAPCRSSASDLDPKFFFQGDLLSTRSIFPIDPRGDEPENFGSGDVFLSPESFTGRIDVAASDIRDIRQVVAETRDDNYPDSSVPRPWRADLAAGVDDGLGSGQDLLASLFVWPRAEKHAPGAHRVDQALTNSVLGSSCSNFIVEWTWSEGVGEHFAPDGTYWHGMHYDPRDSWRRLGGDSGSGSAHSGLRWFGLVDQDRSVHPYSAFASMLNYPTDGPVDPSDNWSGLTRSAAAASINPLNVEPIKQSLRSEDVDDGAREYWALFGYNRDRPRPWDTDDNGLADFADPQFTPWPTALRFTMHLHDADGNLINGHPYQFIVELPEHLRQEAREE